MKNNFKDYIYLGNVIPEVPKPWESIILAMFKAIDTEIRPWYKPRILSNYLSKENKEEAFLSIKQKFGTLRVKHTFSSEKIKGIISSAEKMCNDTCEFCGTIGTTQVTVKNWVRNLCSKCIEINKK